MYSNIYLIVCIGNTYFVLLYMGMILVPEFHLMLAA